MRMVIPWHTTLPGTTTHLPTWLDPTLVTEAIRKRARVGRHQTAGLPVFGIPWCRHTASWHRATLLSSKCYALRACLALTSEDPPSCPRKAMLAAPVHPQVPRLMFWTGPGLPITCNLVILLMTRTRASLRRFHRCLQPPLLVGRLRARLLPHLALLDPGLGSHLRLNSQVSGHRRMWPRQRSASLTSVRFRNRLSSCPPVEFPP